MLDRSGGHLHPLNLALGQAAALERLGGMIHEASPVTRVEGIGTARPVVRTAAGAVRARGGDPRRQRLSRAGGAGAGEPGDAVLDADHGDRAAGRARADAAADRRLRRGRALCARLLPAERGRAAARGAAARSTAAPTRPTSGPSWCRTWCGCFPSCGACGSTMPGRATARSRSAGCRSWGGSGPAAYFAQGYSGHGVVGSHLFGRILAEAVDGDVSRFDVFARVPWIPFPGGRRFAVPYSVLGSWWYGLRDRLGA